MTQWVSFEEIKQNVTMEAVLEHYGLLDRLKQRRDELIGLCPFHEESRGSFYANTKKNVFQCFGCKAKGNVLDFVALMERVDIREAGLLLQDWFQIVAEKPSGTSSDDRKRRQPRSRIIKPEQTKNTPLSFELKLDPTHPYVRQRGLTSETIDYFGLGYAARGVMQGRIAIPIHDECGELVAYAGRWPGEPPDNEGRYRLPPNFHKSLVVYNLHRASEQAKKEKRLVVVEGFFPCFWLWQAGINNVVALMGSSLSTRQKELLVDCLSSDGALLLLFDNDKAGQLCGQQCLDELSLYFPVKSLHLPNGCHQPDDMTPKQIRELLALP